MTTSPMLFYMRTCTTRCYTRRHPETLKVAQVADGKSMQSIYINYGITKDCVDCSNMVARECYYQLSQLRVLSRSLTHQSTLPLVRAFVTSRIDCCSVLCRLGFLLVP